MQKIPELPYVNIISSKDNFIELCRQHYLFYVKKRADNPKKINFSSKKVKERVNKEVRKELDELNTYRGCVFHHTESVIYLNLKTLFEDFPIDTEKHICDTLSHETIYLVIRILENQEVSTQYDNIYRGLRHQGFSGC